MTTRRAFLASVAAALAGAAFVEDPERALWVPGKKLISIPKTRPRFIIFPRDVLIEWGVRGVSLINPDGTRRFVPING